MEVGEPQKVNRIPTGSCTQEEGKRGIGDPGHLCSPQFCSQKQPQVDPAKEGMSKLQHMQRNALQP